MAILSKTIKERSLFSATINQKESRLINPKTKVFVFDDDGHQSNTFESIKAYYPDLSMLGKHYLVNSTLQESGQTIYRHYTISNCMRREFYEELLKCLSQA